MTTTHQLQQEFQPVASCVGTGAIMLIPQGFGAELMTRPWVWSNTRMVSSLEPHS